MANLKAVYQRPARLPRQPRRGAGVLRRARSPGRRGRSRRYKKEILRLLAEVTLGSGALAVIGGTVGVITGLAFFTGTEVGLQGYAALNQIGTAAFSGFVSAYFNTREISPLVAGIALAATVGCGFTAQLGAMRISEEVDALEVMAIPSLPFLVTTRIIAGLVAVTPLYVVGLLSSYFATRLTVTQFFGQSTGTYDHYFNQFLPPGDVLWSFGKVLIFSVVVILIHCYHGYNASGGPAGVGVAVGRAVRTSHRRDQRHRPVPVDGDLGHHHDRQAGGLADERTHHGRHLRRRSSTVCWASAFLLLLLAFGWLDLRDLQPSLRLATTTCTLRTSKIGLQLPDPRGREDPRRAGRARCSATSSDGSKGRHHSSASTRARRT